MSKMITETGLDVIDAETLNNSPDARVIEEKNQAIRLPFENKFQTIFKYLESAHYGKPMLYFSSSWGEIEILSAFDDLLEREFKSYSIRCNYDFTEVSKDKFIVNNKNGYVVEKKYHEQQGESEDKFDLSNMAVLVATEIEEFNSLDGALTYLEKTIQDFILDTIDKIRKTDGTGILDKNE